MPRRYSMERRSASVDETRDRIINATMALHDEQGILATSMQDIAARAGVALGTVYRHFPSVDQLVPACGGRKMELYPPPSPDVFEALEGAARVKALLEALYAHYEAMERPYYIGYAEASKLPVLRGLMDQADAHVRSLVAQAIGPSEPSEESMGVAVAMADFYTWFAFNRAGFSSAAAAEVAASIVDAHLSSSRGRL
jgi:AcrR family transcriptional regulator